MCEKVSVQFEIPYTKMEQKQRQFYSVMLKEQDSVLYNYW